MSRAFVKEADGEDFVEDLVERPISPHPNFVTARGLALIDAEIARLQSEFVEQKSAGERGAVARLSRDLRYWTARRTSAQLVAPTGGHESGGHEQHGRGKGDHEIAGFGVLVTFEHEDGRRQSLRIVGEDEADPVEGRISWRAPIAQALAGSGIGDYVEVPAGEVEIVALDATPEPETTSLPGG